MKSLRNLWYGALLLWAFACGALAGTVTLAWDPSPELKVTHYELRYGTDPLALTTKKQVARSVTQLLVELEPGVYYFEVFAVAGTLESAPSNQVEHTARPAALKLRVVVTQTTKVVHPEESDWETLAVAPLPSGAVAARAFTASVHP